MCSDCIIAHAGAGVTPRRRFESYAKDSLLFTARPADRKQGGHVLDCQVDKATASIDLTKEFDLVPPNSEKFESTDFTVDRSADVKKAETNE